MCPCLWDVRFSVITPTRALFLPRLAVIVIGQHMPDFRLDTELPFLVSCCHCCFVDSVPVVIYAMVTTHT